VLVLKRKEGEWVDIKHRSGDVIRVRVYGIHGTNPGKANLAFDDPMHNFDVQRPERKDKDAAAEAVGGDAA
jgi:sRNA-binding carbon storage regulator CsrA